jgi:hypothetical protein
VTRCKDEESLRIEKIKVARAYFGTEEVGFLSKAEKRKLSFR